MSESPEELQRQIEALQAQLAALQTQQQQVQGQVGVSGDASIAGPAVGVNLGAIIQGDISGNVYLAGQRGKNHEDLLAAYLQRLRQRCVSMSFQGVYEQKSDTDTLCINLTQVYTQLATTDSTEREVYAGEALQSFDADAYLKAHTGATLLPLQQRHRVRPVGVSVRQEGLHELVPGPVHALGGCARSLCPEGRTAHLPGPATGDGGDCNHAAPGSAWRTRQWEKYRVAPPLDAVSRGGPG